MPLARHLVAKGYFVKGSTRSASRIDKISSGGAQPFIVDIENRSNDIRKFLQSDILIVNIPTDKLLWFQELRSRIEGSKIRNLIFVSSTSVYPSSNQVITEDTEIMPKSSPLLAIEDLFRGSKAIGTTVLRFGGLIGYDRHPGRFFSEKPVPNADSPVNMIHRDDCVKIIEQIIARGAWGEVFNCCADSHPTKRDFYTKLAGDLGQKPPVFSENDISSNRIVSNAKLKRYLNFQFTHPDLMDLKLSAD